MNLKDDILLKSKNYCIKKTLFENTGASPIKKPQYIEGRVHPHTLVRDVIGFICWKYINEGIITYFLCDNSETVLPEKVLYSVIWQFFILDLTEKRDKSPTT